MGYLGPHGIYYRDLPVVVAAPTIPEILASVAASWVGWWTTYDPTLAADPGVTLDTGTVVSWADQRQGNAILPALAANQPPYGADGSHCGGRSAIQFAIVGAKHLGGGADFAANLLLAGTAPYYVYVVRSRTAPIAAERLTEVSLGGTSVSLPIQLSTTESVIAAPTTGFSVTATSVLDRNPHVIEAYAPPASGPTLRIDGGTAVVNVVGATSISNNVNRLSLGSNRFGSGAFGDNSLWELFVFTSYIGDTIALELVDALLTKWGL